MVDETSMVSLTMMARLLEALRPTTRLVLVGDPDQLASVEAGAVLGDLADAPGPPGRRRHAGDQPTLPGDQRHRAAGRPRCSDGRADDALEVLRADDTPEVELVEVADDAHLSAAQLDGVRADVVVSGGALLDAAERGDAAGGTGGARPAPAAVRAPPRTPRRPALERARRAVDRRRAPGAAAGRRALRRRAAAGHRERLRDRALQRRHRRRGGRRRRAGCSPPSGAAASRSSCRSCGWARCARCTR